MGAPLRFADIGKREKKIILRNVMHKEIVYINSGR